MADVLISGPAGAGKSQEAARLRAAATVATVLVDFQSLYVAISGDVRLTDGSYPRRDPSLLPVTEYLRRSAITAARERDLAIVATNSDGDPERRAFLLGLLAPGAVETVIDPGRVEVTRRLTNRATGLIDPECLGAIARWYV